VRYRHLRRTLIAALAGAALLLGLLVALQRAAGSPAVAAVLTHRLERWIGDATGGDVTIGHTALSIVPLRLELGAVRAGFPGWEVTIRRLTLSGAAFRAARGRLDLGTVVVEGVRLRASTLPVPHRRAGPGGWLRVRVGHLELHDVLVEGLPLPGRLRLDAGPVEAGWTATGGPPRGFFRSGPFRLEIPAMEPVRGTLAARLRLEDGVVVPHLVLRSDLVSGEGRGSLRGGAVWLAFRGSGRLERLSRSLHLGGLLAGPVSLDLRLDTLTSPPLHVRVASPRLTASGFPVEDLRGLVTIGPDGLHARLERARYHGGTVRGRYTLAPLGRPWHHGITLEGRGVALEPFLGDVRMPPVGLAGRFDASVSLAWKGRRIREGHGTADVTVHPAAGPLPVEGEMRLALAPPGVLQLDGRGLAIGRSTVDLQGPLTLGDWIPSWSLAIRTRDLPEIVRVTDALVGRTVLPKRLDGAGTLHLGLSGPWKAPHVSIEADLAPLVLAPVALDHAAVTATVAGSRLTIGRAVFRIGRGGGRARGTVRWDRPEDQLALQLTAMGVPLETVGGWLHTPVELEGKAAFSGTLGGSVARPSGSFALGLTGVEVAGVPFGHGSARVELERGTFTARAIAFEGGASGEASWDVAGRRVEGALRWSGFDPGVVHPLLARLTGGHGTLEASVDWPLDGVASARASIRTPGASVGVRTGEDGVHADLHLEGAAEGGLDLRRTADGLEGGGSVRVDDVGAVLDRLLPGRGIPLDGRVLCTLAVRWPDGGAPELRGTLDRVELTLGERPVRLVRPAPFVLEGDGAARLDELRLAVGGDEVAVAVARGADGTLDGTVRGTLDGLLLRLVLPRWEPAGRLEGTVRILGTVTAPRLRGRLRVAQGSFRLPGSPMIATSIDGAIELDETEALLSGVRLRIMGGDATVDGTVRLRDGRPVLALEGSARAVRYTVLPGFEARLSGSWWLRGPPDGLELGGRLTVDRTVLRRRDDPATLLLEWFGGGGQGRPPERPRLALHVEADRTIEMRSPFVHIVASAVLDISGTPARPGVVGRIELAEGGDLFLRGVRYELDRCVLLFTDPSSIEPRIDLEARTWVDVYAVTILLQGTPRSLHPVLTSDPPLQEADILSLLSLGRRTGREEEGMGAVLASSILTSQINAELDRRARSILAVDQLRIDPFSESTTGNPTARVTLVKQLAPNWTLVVQSNLSSNREEVVISRWYLSRGLFLEATRDTDGSYSLDIKLRRRY